MCMCVCVYVCVRAYVCVHVCMFVIVGVGARVSYIGMWLCMGMYITITIIFRR